MGGNCLQTTCRAGFYEPNINDYRIGYFISTDKNDKDISSMEQNWGKNKKGNH